MLKYQDFQLNQWEEIELKLKKYFLTANLPHYAAFDADGTIWDEDAGEVFFQYQIENCNLKNLPTDPWKHYHDWKAHDPRGAYLWLAQINTGHSLAQIRAWAKDCYKSHKSWPYFEPQKKIIEWLKRHGVRVFIVTASIKWAVEPFVEFLGLHYDHVIGVETQVENGIITDSIRGRITWREGKPLSLLEKTQGVRPIFCSGNTTGDTALIESSQLIKMAVCSSSPGDELYNTEMDLQKLAIENQWYTHRFKSL